MRRPVVIILIGFIVLGVGLGLLISPKKNKISKIEKNLEQSSFWEEAESLLAKGDFIGAREIYKKAAENTQDADKLKEIQKRREEINMKIIFSPLIIDECSTKYIVKPKDTLIKIANKFNTTVNLIERVNNLKSSLIKPAQELKVNTCKYSIVVDKSQNLLFLKRKEEVIKSYIVATGEGDSTPLGNFKIVDKLINPTWFKKGAVIGPNSPDNILGSRWLGFDRKGYGIHGTNQPETVGKHITLGCVRMKNEDVEELFDIVPVGTEVTIID